MFKKTLYMLEFTTRVIFIITVLLDLFGYCEFFKHFFNFFLNKNLYVDLIFIKLKEDFLKPFIGLEKEDYPITDESKLKNNVIYNINSFLLFLKTLSIMLLFLFYSFFVKISDFLLTFKFGIEHFFFLRIITLIIIFILPLNLWITIIDMLFLIKI